MSSNINLKKTGDEIILELSGPIYEEFELSKEALSGSQKIIVDFEKVTAINSCGIREWIRSISNHQNCEIIYKNCPKTIVDQINMVAGFLPQNGRVESFFVPYFSEETNEEKSVLFIFGKEFDHDKINLPTSIVDSQNNPMELDVFESKYFYFLKNRMKAAS